MQKRVSEVKRLFIDVKPILTGAVDVIEFDDTLAPPAPFNGIEFPEPVRVVSRIKNMAGYMTLTASASVPYITRCARCLKEISRVFTHTFTRTLATRLQNGENDDYLLIRDDRVALDEPLLEDLVLNLDFVYLCKEDCKGLCPKCGKDRNEGECGCSDKKEVDPRLAILAKFLDK